MICWSCERAAGGGATCQACGAVLPPDRAADFFSVLGVPPGFAVDVATLERRYKELTRALHPDRFARADARARRASLERSVQLNEAWRTLRDPVRRAEYLLRLRGVDVADERAGASPALLMEVMELRERLAEARAARDAGRVEALADDVRQRRDGGLRRVEEALARGDLAVAAEALGAIRYWARFLDEVGAFHEAAEDGVHA